jgi:hypothetical protein
MKKEVRPAMKPKLKSERGPDNHDAVSEGTLLSDEITDFIERKDELLFNIDTSQFHVIIEASFDSQSVHDRDFPSHVSFSTYQYYMVILL